MEGPNRLVGRDAEFAVVRGLLPAARDGGARVVGLCGTAGIGKSWLAHECLREAERQGFRSLSGSGAVLQRDLAYAPVVEALRPLVDEPDLVADLPDLGSLFGGLPSAAPQPDGTGRQRIRLFESVRRLLERAADRRPLALLVDDVHWVDRDSLALLHYLVRGLARRRLLVLLSYRDDEAQPPHRELLDALGRAGILTELPLTALSESSIGTLVTDLLGATMAPDSLRTLATRSGGVPLFVTALAASWVDRQLLRRDGGHWVLVGDADEAVPGPVSELLRSRIERLPRQAREVLDQMAICGPAAEHPVLCRLLAEDQLLAGLAVLRGANLVVEEAVDAGVGYRTTHPLVAEVAYGLLPLVVRRRGHASVAAAVRRLWPSRLGLLAQHLRLAADEVDATGALETLTAAADDAVRRQAGDEALVHLRYAHDLTARLARTDLIPGLLDRIARSEELVGDRARTVRAWVAAADRYAPPASTERLCRAAGIEFDAGRLDEYHRLLSRVEDQLAGVPLGRAHALLAATRGWVAMRADNSVEHRARIEELDRLYELTGVAEARRVALGARCDAAMTEGRYQEVRQHVLVAIDMAATVGDEMAEVARRPGSLVELQWGDLAAARVMAEEGLTIARRFGVPVLERVPRTTLALTAFFAGEWPEALRGAEAVIELGSRLGTPRCQASGLAVRALVELRRGLLDQACESAAVARSAQGPYAASDSHLLSLLEPVEATAALGRGQPDAAARIATESLTRGNGTTQPLVWSVLAEAHLAMGRPDAALSAAERLSGLGPGAPYPGALAAWVSGRVRRDPALLSRATEELTALGYRYEALVCGLDLVELTGEHPGSDRLDALERMGAQPPLDRARQLARRLGQRAAPPRPGGGPLSVREEQVARLVAEGLSNAEIAARLFLSTRTVTTHLQNIYRRLGVGSRAVLTRYVLEQLPPNRSSAASR